MLLGPTRLPQRPPAAGAPDAPGTSATPDAPGAPAARAAFPDLAAAETTSVVPLLAAALAIGVAPAGRHLVGVVGR